MTLLRGNFAGFHGSGSGVMMARCTAVMLLLCSSRSRIAVNLEKQATTLKGARQVTRDGAAQSRALAYLFLVIAFTIAHQLELGDGPVGATVDVQSVQKDQIPSASVLDGTVFLLQCTNHHQLHHHLPHAAS
jgi:hypothetical protein